MRAGEFENGSHVLRAKIDMASPNIQLRDPVLYRIVHASHHRTGDAWCIYPTYDLAHGQSDAIEGVTHSLCTLEFEIHRPLYDWLIEHLPLPSKPRQIEFARLTLTHTVLSKRVLKRLVDEGHVRGWDDPRMPTISGLRRRGFPAEGIRDFATEIGVAKADSVHEIELLEHSVRAGLEPDRAAAVRGARSAEGGHHQLARGPGGVDGGRQQPGGPVGRHAPGGVRPRAVDRARRLHGGAAAEVLPSVAGREVRLRDAYFVTCQRGRQGRVRHGGRAPLHVRPADPGGDSPDGRKVKATLHWVSAAHAVPAEVRLYDHLFTRPDPGADGDLFADLNPASETIVRGAMLEPASRTRRPARPSSSSGWAISRRTGLNAQRARVQPDAHAEGHLGQGADQAVITSLEWPGFTTGGSLGRSRARASRGSRHRGAAIRSSLRGH